MRKGEAALVTDDVSPAALDPCVRGSDLGIYIAHWEFPIVLPADLCIAFINPFGSSAQALGQGVIEHGALVRR